MIMSTNKVLAVAAAAFLTLSACAARQNLALERARAAYQSAERSPQVSIYAGPELARAEGSLLNAEAAFLREESRREVDHLALVAEKEVDIARSRAAERAATVETAVLHRQREEIVERERTELELRLAELQARETERGLVVTLGDVLFETDRADLRPGASDKLAQLVTVLRENPDRAVLVEGHADARGTASYNLDLSRRRAETVRRFFVSRGIGGERIVATGYGEEYPVASNGTMEGQTMNRRVEVVLLNAGATPEVSQLIVR